MAASPGPAHNYSTTYSVDRDFDDAGSVAAVEDAAGGFRSTGALSVKHSYHAALQ